MKHFCGVQNREVNTWEVVSHKKECTAGKREGKRKKNRIGKSNRERKEIVGEKEFNSLNGGEMMKEKFEKEGRKKEEKVKGEKSNEYRR